MNIETLKKKMLVLNESLTSIMEENGYSETADLLSVEWNEKDPNECMLHDELFGLFQQLDCVHSVLTYLEKPIIHEGVLTYNRNCRYAIGDYELNEGDILEVLELDEYTKNYVWRETHVPRRDNSKEVFKSLVSEGKKARIRK